MTTLETEVQWVTNKTPKICFDFAYEKKRSGSTQCYQVKVTCRPLYTDTAKFGYPIYVQISLDGTQKTSFTLKSSSPNQWDSSITHTTGWLEVANKTSGTTAIKIRIYSGSGSSRDQSYSYTLPIDPAASTISTAAASYDIEGYPTIVINRASSSFTHAVTYAFEGLTGTAKNATSATKITDWQIPESFYAKIPKSKKATCTLTCITYSGGSEVGRNTCTFDAVASESRCKPTVTGNVIDNNSATTDLTGNPNVLIKYCSTARCTITATANKQASGIAAKTINNVAVSGEILDIPNVETGVFEFYAKDSRGWSNSDKEVKTIVPYIPLTCSAEVRRTDPTSGTAILTIKGKYYKGSFGAVENTLTVSYSVNGADPVMVEVEPGETSYEVSVKLTELDYQSSHRVKVEVKDKLNTIPKTATLSKGIPVFDWGENDFAFHVPVHFDQSVSGAYIRTKRLSGTADITLQSRFASFDTAATARQSVFLFGWDNGRAVTGLLCLNYDGTAAWSGSEGVTVAAGENGKFTITLPGKAYDWFTLISAEYISL